MVSAGLSLLLFMPARAQPQPAAPKTPQYARVVAVIDGDTIQIDADGDRLTCRLLGVDAPELSYAPLWTELDKLTRFSRPDQADDLRDAEERFRKRAETLQRHARNARDTLAKTIQGKVVALAYDSTTDHIDRYGRLLAYVELNGVDINAELIRVGLACPETRFRSDRLSQYVQLSRVAQDAHVGIWK